MRLSLADGLFCALMVGAGKRISWLHRQRLHGLVPGARKPFHGRDRSAAAGSLEPG